MRTLPSLLLLALLTPVIGIAAPQVQAGRGGTAVSVQGDHNTVTIQSVQPQKLNAVQRDTQQILAMLVEIKREKDDKSQRASQLEQENEQLKAQMAQLAARLAQETQKGENHPLAEQALQGLQHGDLKPTATYLQQAEQAAQTLIEKASNEAAQARQTAAENARQLAAISDTQTALAALQRAVKYAPEDAQNWLLLGNLEKQAGNTTHAEQAYREALQRSDIAVQNHPENPIHQRNLFTTLKKMGDLQVEQGNLIGALASYQRYLSICQRLTQQEATNTEWQRNLSISHNKIGEIQQAQGDLSGALGSYRKGLEIAERLAQQDAANSLWQRDLSISHNKIGEIQQAQGDLSGALGSYQKSLDIFQRLAQHDAENVQWQTDVVLSYWRMASLRGQDGVSDQDAKKYVNQAIVIMARLAKAGKLNASQQDWEQRLRDLLAQIGVK